MFSTLDRFDTAAKSEDGEWMTLRSPADNEPILNPKADGTSVPLRLKLAGPDSERYMKLSPEVIRRSRRAMSLDPKNELDPKLGRRIRAEAMVSVVLDWDGFDEEFNQQNVDKLLTKFPWVVEQVDLFCSTRANFLPKTAPSSSVQPQSGSSGTSD